MIHISYTTAALAFIIIFALACYAFYQRLLRMEYAKQLTFSLRFIRTKLDAAAVREYDAKTQKQ